MNGLVLGNDPAVHLQRAESFLSSGTIPISDIAWYPPLYHIFLSTLIAFTGTTDIGSLLFLIKTLAVLIDWLLILSVYLLGAKFFNKKIGFLAALFLFLCFPLYEINQWGGYTTILSLGMMSLLFVYLSLERKGLGNTLTIFALAFSLVLTHQLTTFLAFIIFPPFIFIMLIKSKGNYPKAWVAALIGGAIAFSLYYLIPLLPYLGSFIDIVFFQLETMLFQIPAVSLEEFIINFGFILFLAFFGIILTFIELRKKGSLGIYLLLSLAFYVPLFFSQSYLVGIYLPYQRFVYYLLPSIAIFSAVSFGFILNQIIMFKNKFEKKWKKHRPEIITYSLIFLLSFLFIFRFGVVYGKILEGSVFYSTSDVKGFDAAIWLRDNYPEPTTVVVTEVPGSWFGVFSEKSVFAETDPIVERNVIAESVLDLAYELEHPLTLVRTYESKGAISSETYISINSVWKRVAYSSGAGDFLSYKINGDERFFELHSLHREIIFEDQFDPKKISIHYFNDEVSLYQTLQFQNSSYPINVNWTISSESNDLVEVKLYLSNFLELAFSFTEAYVPGVLEWENPWDNPSNYQENTWAVTNFTETTLTGNLIGLYDETEESIFALRFTELPDWGNVGALSSRQIDAIRFQYQFEKVEINHEISLNYDVLSFSRKSYPEIQELSGLNALFDLELISEHNIASRDYHDYIKDNKIEFIVYDKNQLDTKLVNSKLLKLIYSNDRYVIFKIKKII
ncbi:MAG: hypothetical protein NWF10_02760 [Candidatus Bathyarchaeota archaeon]|nr:hypothetical protein [Candidatus Bathyarchaeota archaeon]